MNETLKAVIIELTGGNVRNHHINLHGAYGLFPKDAFGGSNRDTAGKEIKLILGAENIDTDIDQTKGIFRERGGIRRLFEKESMTEGDLVVIERIGPRSFSVRKASKRGFNYYL